MPRFSKYGIAVMRRNVGEMLTDVCRIEREDYARGPMHEEQHIFRVVAEDVPCRLVTVGRRSGSSTSVVGGQETMKEQYRLVCGRDEPFTVDDRVVMADGRIFQVVDALDGLTDSGFVSAIVVRARGVDFE